METTSYCTGMQVTLLKSGSRCEFVSYKHDNKCVIRRIDTGKTMLATLAGISPSNAPHERAALAVASGVLLAFLVGGTKGKNDGQILCR